MLDLVATAIVGSMGAMFGWALFGACIGLAAARARGHDPAGTALGGALLGLFALLIYLLPSGHVRCPHCLEWVNKKASACRHCGRDLVPGVVPKASRPAAAPSRAATARPDGQSFRCAKPGCGRLLTGPRDTCTHCGTAHA